MGKPGSIPSSSRRRRGGGRGARRGSVARGGEVQREGEWRQEVAGVPRVAVEQQEVACGPPRRRRRCSAPTEEDCWTFLQFLKNLGILL